MIKFEKVSYRQFEEAYIELNPELTCQEIQAMYDKLELPKRATTASAGYDFKAPFAFELAPGETIKIPSGIRAIMPDNVVLLCFPRSGLGFKYRFQMDNSIPVIDADYYKSDNEGHIFFKCTNDSKQGKVVNIEAGKGFAQGIFVNYLTTDNDNATGERNGGMGSTDKAQTKERINIPEPKIPRIQDVKVGDVWQYPYQITCEQPTTRYTRELGLTTESGVVALK